MSKDDRISLLFIEKRRIRAYDVAHLLYAVWEEFGDEGLAIRQEPKERWVIVRLDLFEELMRHTCEHPEEPVTFEGEHD